MPQTTDNAHDDGGDSVVTIRTGDDKYFAEVEWHEEMSGDGLLLYTATELQRIAAAFSRAAAQQLRREDERIQTEGREADRG